MTEVPQSDGDWVKEGKLGQGGFGQVYLYKNKATGQHIAVKKCGVNNDITPRLLLKWKDEVEIMGKINHENIVRALPTPDFLAPQANEPPSLVMEYCSGGDLRNMLTKTPCGMKESALRWLVSNISKGVEHLHSMKITHRDLKPENIVISRRGPTERDVVYKIIDLGYAKELFDSSLLYSFVGTMQYLAPELMNKKGYTRTVDFWSFGVVLFECITGVRPFLPSEVPFRWFAEVQKKRQDDICIFYNMDGDIVATDRLLFPNHLCRTSRAFFEQFLKLMLRWDPETRGGRAVTGSQRRDKCWSLLDNILSSPLIFIYCVPDNALLTYPVEDKHTVKDVLKALERELNIPMTELELINAYGAVLPLNQPARSFCGLDEQPSVYLFKRYTEENASEILPKIPNDSEPFPEVVRFMIHREDIALPPEDQLKFMSQAAFYCEEKAKEFFRIYMASKSMWMNLNRESSEFVRNRNVIRSELAIQKTLVDFCDSGFEFDIAQYESQAHESNGSARFESTKTINSWKAIREELAAMKLLEEEVNRLNESYTAIQAGIEELKAHPYSPVKPYPGQEIHKLFEKSHEIYREVRRSRREDGKKPTNKDMLSCVTQSKIESDKQTNGLHALLRLMLSRKNQLIALCQQLSAISARISHNKDQVRLFQQKKQEDLWRFIKLALTNRPPSRQSSESNGTSAALQTTVMIARASMESMRAVNQYEHAKNKADSLLSQSGDEGHSSSSNPDWSFLDGHTPT